MKKFYPSILVYLSNRKSQNPVFNKNCTSVLAFFATTCINAQSVSGIITDYNNFWKTSASSMNAIKPVNSHNLLAFTYNNIQYSTGVNDQALSSHGESFVAGDFWSLPVAGLTGNITGNTKVGVGEMYDGRHGGASSVPPDGDIAQYLTDGIKGLNIGTGVANLPAGNMSFNVNTIDPQNIGDGVPDIIVTQIADPSGSTDGYSFMDVSGNIVGHKKNIVFTSITPVANWTADFYEASVRPMTLISGFTNTDRPLRIWAADLSEFGVTAANYSSVKKFTINLSGNSDVAFVGYNNKSFSVVGVLPVTLSDFSGKSINSKTQLNWTTQTEENTSHFTIERSAGNNAFIKIADIMATGNSNTAKQYTLTDSNPADGTNYYRLKISDKDGSFTYSKVIMIEIAATAVRGSLSPNPSSDNVIMTHPASVAAAITVYNAVGIAVSKTTVSANTLQTKLNIQSLGKGMYYAVWQNATDKISLQLVKK